MDISLSRAKNTSSRHGRSCCRPQALRGNVVIAARALFKVSPVARPYTAPPTAVRHTTGGDDVKKPRKKTLKEIKVLVNKAIYNDTLEAMLLRVDHYVLKGWMTQTGAEKVCRWISERAEHIRMGYDQRVEYPEVSVCVTYNHTEKWTDSYGNVKCQTCHPRST